MPRKTENEKKTVESQSQSTSKVAVSSAPSPITTRRNSRKAAESTEILKSIQTRSSLSHEHSEENKNIEIKSTTRTRKALISHEETEQSKEPVETKLRRLSSISEIAVKKEQTQHNENVNTVKTPIRRRSSIKDEIKDEGSTRILRSRKNSDAEKNTAEMEIKERKVTRSRRSSTGTIEETLAKPVQLTPIKNKRRPSVKENINLETIEEKLETTKNKSAVDKSDMLAVTSTTPVKKNESAETSNSEHPINESNFTEDTSSECQSIVIHKKKSSSPQIPKIAIEQLPAENVSPSNKMNLQENNSNQLEVNFNKLLLTPRKSPRTNKEYSLRKTPSPPLFKLFPEDASDNSNRDINEKKESETKDGNNIVEDIKETETSDALNKDAAYESEMLKQNMNEEKAAEICISQNDEEKQEDILNPSNFDEEKSSFVNEEIRENPNSEFTKTNSTSKEECTKINISSDRTELETDSKTPQSDIKELALEETLNTSMISDGNKIEHIELYQKPTLKEVKISEKEIFTNSKTDENNTKTVLHVERQENVPRVSNVFKPRMKENSFMEPMEVDDDSIQQHSFKTSVDYEFDVPSDEELEMSEITDSVKVASSQSVTNKEDDIKSTKHDLIAKSQNSTIETTNEELQKHEVDVDEGKNNCSVADTIEYAETSSKYSGGDGANTKSSSLMENKSKPLCVVKITNLNIDNNADVRIDNQQLVDEDKNRAKEQNKSPVEINMDHANAQQEQEINEEKLQNKDLVIETDKITKLDTSQKMNQTNTEAPIDNKGENKNKTSEITNESENKTTEEEGLESKKIKRHIDVVDDSVDEESKFNSGNEEDNVSASPNKKCDETIGQKKDEEQNQQFRGEEQLQNMNLASKTKILKLDKSQNIDQINTVDNSGVKSKNTSKMAIDSENEATGERGSEEFTVSDESIEIFKNEETKQFKNHNDLVNDSILKEVCKSSSNNEEVYFHGNTSEDTLGQEKDVTVPVDNEQSVAEQNESPVAKIDYPNEQQIQQSSDGKQSQKINEQPKKIKRYIDKVKDSVREEVCKPSSSNEDDVLFNKNTTPKKKFNETYGQKKDISTPVDNEQAVCENIDTGADQNESSDEKCEDYANEHQKQQFTEGKQLQNIILVTENDEIMKVNTSQKINQTNAETLIDNKDAKSKIKNPEGEETEEIVLEEFTKSDQVFKNRQSKKFKKQELYHTELYKFSSIDEDDNVFSNEISSPKKKCKEIFYHKKNISLPVVNEVSESEDIATAIEQNKSSMETNMDDYPIGQQQFSNTKHFVTESDNIIKLDESQKIDPINIKTPTDNKGAKSKKKTLKITKDSENEVTEEKGSVEFTVTESNVFKNGQSKKCKRHHELVTDSIHEFGANTESDDTFFEDNTSPKKKCKEKFGRKKDISAPSIEQNVSSVEKNMDDCANTQQKPKFSKAKRLQNKNMDKSDIIMKLDNSQEMEPINIESLIDNKHAKSKKKSSKITDDSGNESINIFKNRDSEKSKRYVDVVNDSIHEEIDKFSSSSEKDYVFSDENASTMKRKKSVGKEKELQATKEESQTNSEQIKNLKIPNKRKSKEVYEHDVCNTTQTTNLVKKSKTRKNDAKIENIKTDKKLQKRNKQQDTQIKDMDDSTKSKLNDYLFESLCEFDDEDIYEEGEGEENIPSDGSTDIIDECELMRNYAKIENTKSDQKLRKTNKRQNTNVDCSPPTSNKQEKLQIKGMDNATKSKLNKYLFKRLSEFDNEDDSSSSKEDNSDQTNNFIDDEAEEGEEDTPSEGSNDIIDEGESINSTDSEIELDDEYDDDSFICDDEIVELLSGEEYDLEYDDKSSEKSPQRSRILQLDESNMKPAKNQEEFVKHKKSRIILISDSSENSETETADTSEIEMCVQESTEVPHTLCEEELINKEIDVDEINTFAISDHKKYETNDSSIINTGNQNVQTPIKFKSKTLVTVYENISVNELKDSALSERISLLVDSFCNREKREMPFNLYLEYVDEGNFETSKTGKSDKIDESLNRSSEEITSEIVGKSSEMGSRERDISKLEDISPRKKSKRLNLTMNDTKLAHDNKVVKKRRISKSLDDLETSEKSAKKTKLKDTVQMKLNKKRKNVSKTNKIKKLATSEESFLTRTSGIMNQLITDVKNRPVRSVVPSCANIINNLWNAEVTDTKPSKTLVKKRELKKYKLKTIANIK